MLLDHGTLEDYLADIAELLERYGVVLDLPADGPLVLDETPSHSLAFELRGFLPDGRRPLRSVLELREVWRPTTQGTFERWEYEYELLDHDHGFRRAFHRHDAEFFVRRFQVVVHEHCEAPIGSAPCPHVAGSPVRDAFQAVDWLVAAWVDPAVPDCSTLPCLE